MSKDASVEAMLADDEGRYQWLKPLNDFRSYLLARHYDPTARCWIARTVDPETGSIQIMPNAYSADFTKELLGILLTIQRDEAIAAARLGINPRFQILSERQLLALDFLLARYGYQKPFTALQMYKAVNDGARWEIPDLSTIPTFTKADVSFRAAMPFADHEYFSPCNGLQSIEHAVVEAQALTTTRSGILVSDVNVGDEFGIDEEGLEMFFEFEVEYALKRFTSPHTNPYPSSVVHYLLSIGVVHLYKGSHGELDRILRVNNQAWRHGLLPIMHDPQAIIARLKEVFPNHPLCIGSVQAAPRQLSTAEAAGEMEQQAFEFF